MLHNLNWRNIYFTSGPSYRDTSQNIFQSKTRFTQYQSVQETSLSICTQRIFRQTTASEHLSISPTHSTKVENRFLALWEPVCQDVCIGNIKEK